MQTEPGTARRRIKLPRYTGTALVVATALIAVGFIASAMGLNVPLVFVVLATLLLVERTLGDWVGELLGPMTRRVIVVGIAGVLGWQLLTGGGGFRVAAEFLGLDHYWIVTPPGSMLRIPPSSAPTSVAVQPGDSPGTKLPTPTNGTSGGSAPRRSEPDGPRPMPRLRVSSAPSAAGVRLQAHVSGDGDVRGTVEFLINGRRVGSGRVREDGRVEAEVPDPGPGVHRVVAHFRGSGDLGDTTAEMTLVR